MALPENELKDFLDTKVLQYNTIAFIEPDPISVPHRYTSKEDIEIAGFLAATIAWGNRTMITKNGHRMMDLLGDSPYDFVMSHDALQLERLDGFVHRTFNSQDFKHFIKALQHIYSNRGGLHQIFMEHQTDTSLQPAIHALNEAFFEIPHEPRTRKHVADPNKGSVAKRINMCLRWFVRKDTSGVDLGIWDTLSPSKLSCPLDVHSGNVARKLGLLTRKQNDTKALLELDTKLRLLDPDDPVKYDFALFGLGIFEGF
ncbi:TIGR02757 family protein [Flavobacterium crassostreae]|uniref:TIGR02757 family protein n=1 Tax=Flavobacterium crassostreae TaxID=1763534 RepID=A0A1B9E2C8_9FLAO|nr:TIGR02757 family protein [Flavobacterium crassostreae]OCB76104.1 TIGR02757 family protein [Flavobacterium crassostreae]